ncbi:IS66 family transposase [Paenibacillus apii]|uniref:IS66 family transposase n=1 Tax=Paenibacillus apii TaxID=1850370 RepID=UPI001438F938|nr:IS66 family transposase [Paenibacillus apii]NJJ40726.1 IS66 family transposase [Paenibacillus apii]
MKYTAEQIKQISRSDPDTIASFITMLLVHIKKLEARVSELERQLGSNSSNSSKPPSSDGLRKPRSMRPSGGKKGAPRGHDGHTFVLTPHPDEIIRHEVKTCSHCSALLQDIPAQSHTRRQVVDLPLPRLFVTEHQVEMKMCPCCGVKQQSVFPEGVTASVQYGEGWKAWTAYLSVNHCLPLERIAQLFEDLSGHRPSEATLLSHIHRVFEHLEPLEKDIRQRLKQSDLLHADETGLRIEGRLQWLHTATNAEWTAYDVHEKRGKKAFEAMGMLPTYTGILVHDCWASYFSGDYRFEHALCGAHLLRECQGIIDYDKHRWATEMQALLREAWTLTKKVREEGRCVTSTILADLESRYDVILEQGVHEWKSPEPDPSKKRGPKAKSKAANLAERLRLHKPAVLRFLRDERVPFDNSQAERDIRMVKVKQKVSGTFRTPEGAHRFARMWLYLHSS